jgi:hypothetical protein
MAYYKDLRIENLNGANLEVKLNEEYKIEFIYDDNFVFTFDNTIDVEALIDELKEKINVIKALPF